MATARKYRPTESKYKGGAEVMYITYELPQRTRSGDTALYPKVKRVYIAGDVKDWNLGEFAKKSGRKVHGVRIEYTQSRAGYRRAGFTAQRGATEYAVSPAKVGGTTQSFVQVVEVPEKATDVKFHKGELPEKYGEALHDVR